MSAAGAPPALRVLHVVNAMDMGGAESVVVEHVRHASPGVQSLVCALNGGGRALETVRSLGARTFDLAGAGPVARLARLRALMRAERVDVVNAHNPTGTLYGVPAGRWAGVPAVFRTEHTIHYPRRHSGAYPALEVVLTAMCDRVVCVCEAVRASHTRRLAWAAERFVTVVNGVAEHRPSAPRAVLRAALGLEPGAPAALALGGMRMPKAFDVLLEGFARVVRGGSPAQLVMAGDGALRAALERQAGTLGIADRVRWLGARTDGGDLVEACDLFVVSSRREGLSLSLLEA
ncbi:MAG: glycosyltransferase, partial [Candidatus Eisenbacteria bacterium]|nr:glycosyltransferase [Candidatus Eisenbacteria bacterium]